MVYNNTSDYRREKESRQSTAPIKNKLCSDGLISMKLNLPVI